MGEVTLSRNVDKEMRCTTTHINEDLKFIYFFFFRTTEHNIQCKFLFNAVPIRLPLLFCFVLFCFVSFSFFFCLLDIALFWFVRLSVIRGFNFSLLRLQNRERRISMISIGIHFFFRS
jgi:hypothetical protein